LEKIEINDIAVSIVNFFLSEMDYMPVIKFTRDKYTSLKKKNKNLVRPD
jgi:hypothetical protein